MDEPKYSAWCPTSGLSSAELTRDREPRPITRELNSTPPRDPSDSNTSRPRREHREAKRQSVPSPVQQASKEKLYKVHWGRTITKGPSVGTSTSSPITEQAPHARAKPTSTVKRKEIPHELDGHVVKASIPLFPGFGPREPPSRRRRSASLAAVLSDTPHNVNSSSVRRRDSIGQGGSHSKQGTNGNRAISLDKGPPSVLSLVSGVTGVSNSSSGSDSTITQKKYLLSQNRNAGRAHATELPPTIPKPSEQNAAAQKQMADKPSVFSYLEEGEENYPKTQASLNDNPDFLPMNEPRAVRRLVEADGLQHGYSKDAQSHGPSVPRSRPDSYAEATVQSENLTGSEHTQEQMPYHDYHEHRHHESVPASSNTGFHFRPIPGSYIHTPYGPSEPSFDLSPIPNPFPTNIEPHKFSSHAIATSTPQPQSPNFVSGMGIPLPPFVARPPSPTRSLSPETSKEAKDDISGYELLASKLSHDGNGTTSLQIDDTLNERRPSSGSMSSRCEKGSTSSDKEEHYSPALPPLYRKFETLNHRIFLHLQDEIAELEEDLRRIDDADAQARKFAAGYDTSEPIPSSRRADAQLLGELQMSRIDVLGRAFVKIGQYNSALASYTQLLKNLEPAKSEEIQTYQAWMAEHNPIVPREARFLLHEVDLLSIPSFSHRHHHHHHHRHNVDQCDISGTCRKAAYQSEAELNIEGQQPRGDNLPTHTTTSIDQRKGMEGNVYKKPETESDSAADAVDTLTPFQRTMITLLSALLLPLFVFNLVSEFLGRLVVAASIGGAVIAIITPGRVGSFLPAGRGWNWGVYVAAYAGVFVVAAGVA